MPMMATSKAWRGAIPRPDRARAWTVSGLRQLRVDAPPEHGGERHERRGQGGDQDRQDGPPSGPPLGVHPYQARRRTPGEKRDPRGRRYPPPLSSLPNPSRDRGSPGKPPQNPAPGSGPVAPRSPPSGPGGSFLTPSGPPVHLTKPQTSRRIPSKEPTSLGNKPVTPSPLFVLVTLTSSGPTGGSQATPSLQIPGVPRPGLSSEESPPPS